MTVRRKASRSFFPLPLWLIIALLFVGYGLAAVFFPLTPYFNRSPLPDVRTFTPSLWGALAYALWLIILYWLYSQAIRQAPQRLWIILGTAVLLALPLLFTFPINATDVYRYFIRGRVTSIYGDNPFTASPVSFRQDPFWQLAGEWSDETSPYGPLWELTAAGITAVAGDNLYLGLLLFKGLGLLTHLLIGWLIWLYVGTDYKHHATLLWAWNPALLLTFVMDAHNDGLMLLWLVLGIWLAQPRHKRLAPLVQLTLAFLVMCLAPLTKPIGLLPLPFFFIAFWRQLPNLSARLRFLIFSILGGLLLVWLAFWPFGSPLPLLSRLLREADTGGGFSITTLLLLLNQRLSFGFSVDMITNLMRGLAGLGGLWLLWQTRNGRSPLRATAGIFALYLLQALNFRIWYSVWLIPWLILAIGDWQLEDREERHYPSPQNPSSTRHAPRPYYLQIALYFLLATQLSVLIYGHLRVYALDGNHFPAHLLGVPFVFGLPFLLALQIWPIGSEIPSNSPSPPAK